MVTFKILKNKNKYTIEAYSKNIVCGSIDFEILNNTKNLFNDDEFEKVKIVDDNIRKIPFVYLSYIVVNHKFQNKGIANLLMQRFILFVEKNEIKTILLLACPFKYQKTKLLPLDILIKFYEKFNFNEIYNDPDGVLMIKNYKN